MGRYAMWIALMVTLQFSAVLCRNPFQEYFYNKYHHKGHSTTASISSATSDISSEEMTVSSVSDGASQEDLLHSSTEDNSLKNILHSITVENGTTIEGNKTILRYGNTYSADPGLHPGLVAAIVILVIFVGLICCCCCWNACGPRKREGFVLSNESERTTVLPGQNLLNYAHIPNYTEDPAQQHPLHYQSQPVQQYPTYYHSQQLTQPPYFSPVHPSYQHNGPSSTQEHIIPDSPPPPYDALLHAAPPYEKQVENNET